MACIEAPEVLFFDVIKINLKNSQFATTQIDPIFIESCTKDSISVVSTCSNKPSSIGASVENGNILIQCIPVGAAYSNIDIEIMICGKRKGFEDFRLKEKTKQQFIKNETFWSNIDRTKNNKIKIK